MYSVWYSCIINNYASATCGFFLTTTQKQETKKKAVILRCKTGFQEAAEHKMILFLLVKPDQSKKANSLHIECSCINWNLLISIILKTPDISFAPHTVMMSFCWPLLWKFFGKWRNALCNLLIRVICKFSTRALQTYLTQNDTHFFIGSRLMLTCSIHLHSNLIFKILIHVLLLVYGGATAKWQAWEKDLRTDQCCNELGGFFPVTNRCNIWVEMFGPHGGKSEICETRNCWSWKCEIVTVAGWSKHILLGNDIW